MNARQIVIPGNSFIFHEYLQDLKVVVHHVAYCWKALLTKNLFKMFVNTARVPVTFRSILSGHLREVAEPGVLPLDCHDRIVSTEFKTRICDTFLGLCPPFVTDPCVLAKFRMTSRSARRLWFYQQ